jgi:hypothetical protein
MKSKSTRRQMFLAAALPLSASAQVPVRVSEPERERIRRAMQDNAAVLRKIKLAMETEPAFTFRA